jgi:CheY-like chemotaxis protein
MAEEPKLRVLLVEDDAVLSKLLYTRFLHEGLECIVAETGEDALKFLQIDQSYNAILLDISLPGMDGFEVLSNIKRNPLTASIPVIIVSNFSQEKDIEQGKKLGAARYVSKVSVVPSDLVSMVLEESHT